jgi:co-chaperonin GroES (HSP10)
MNVMPKNKYLLVESVKDAPEQESTILVPDDYVASAAKEHELVKILAFAGNCAGRCSYEAGQYVLVEGHMIKNVRIFDQDYRLVQENYVLATVTDVES